LHWISRRCLRIGSEKKLLDHNLGIPEFEPGHGLGVFGMVSKLESFDVQPDMIGCLDLRSSHQNKLDDLLELGRRSWAVCSTRGSILIRS
jgi:hypothetical protein